MKKLLMVIGSILLVALIAAGSFAGGMAYQRNQADQIRQQFFSSRGLPGGFPGGNDGNNNSGQRRSQFGGGFIPGQVKSLDGSVLTISTAQNVTTVNLSDSTQIEKASTAGTSDLQPGLQVLVSGQRDSNGNIDASRVLILGTNPAGAITTP